MNINKLNRLLENFRKEYVNTDENVCVLYEKQKDIPKGCVNGLSINGKNVMGMDLPIMVSPSVTFKLGNLYIDEIKRQETQKGLVLDMISETLDFCNVDMLGVSNSDYKKKKNLTNDILTYNWFERNITKRKLFKRKLRLFRDMLSSDISNYKKATAALYIKLENISEFVNNS